MVSNKTNATGHSFAWVSPNFETNISDNSLSQLSQLIKEKMVFKPSVPPSGVWCPAVTFFDRTSDEIDLESQKKYFHYLSTTGLAGLVMLPS